MSGSQDCGKLAADCGASIRRKLEPIGHILEDRHVRPQRIASGRSWTCSPLRRHGCLGRRDKLLADRISPAEGSTNPAIKRSVLAYRNPMARAGTSGGRCSMVSEMYIDDRKLSVAFGHTRNSTTPRPSSPDTLRPLAPLARLSLRQPNPAVGAVTACACACSGSPSSARVRMATIADGTPSGAGECRFRFSMNALRTSIKSWLAKHCSTISAHRATLRFD